MSKSKNKQKREQKKKSGAFKETKAAAKERQKRIVKRQALKRKAAISVAAPLSQFQAEASPQSTTPQGA